jgi:hypothetical protein
VSPVLSTGYGYWRLRSQLDGGGFIDRMLVGSSGAGFVVLGEQDNWEWSVADKTGGTDGSYLKIRPGKGFNTGAGGALYLDAADHGSASTTEGDIHIGTQYGTHINVGKSASEIGFYGASAVALQALGADPTAAEISTVLHNLGLVS